MTVQTARATAAADLKQNNEASAEVIGFPLAPAQKNHAAFSGAFFLTFAIAAGALGLYCLKPSVSNVESPSFQDILKGRWSPLFEKSLGEVLPLNTPSRNLWGSLEYAAFHQGRKGVVAGENGWLFTDEEFNWPHNAQQNLTDNLAYIAGVKRELADKNIHLAVVLVPAKARVYPQHLGTSAVPSARAGLYDAVRGFLQQQDIPATDLLPVMQSSILAERLYLKNDTHWSPEGARLAAGTAAQVVRLSFADVTLPAQTFKSAAGEEKTHDGDLMRYVPGVQGLSDTYTAVTTDAVPSETANAATGDSLLDDAPAAAAVLVGTSYSANVKWNFAGFLKAALQTDVLNMADEGKGPFAVMDNYLQSDNFKNTPPRVLVWEMPERYFLMPHGVSGQK